MNFSTGIHNIKTLSVRKYGIIDETGNIKLLKKRFNPFPINWFNTDLFFEEFKTIFSLNNNDLVNEKYRLLSYYKIIELDQILKVLIVLMQSENNRAVHSLIFKRKIKNIDLSFYTERVKILTGIEVKDGKDLERLKNETQRQLDKYNERFNKPKKEQPKVSFIEVVLGVFSIMEMNYVPEMTLFEFWQLKKIADKKIKDAGNH